MATPADRAARERKQKIFLVVGGLLLVGIMAIQLPKLMGGSSSAEPSSTTTTASGRPSTSGTPVAAAGGPALPTVGVAQLDSLRGLKRKDPFVQKVKPLTAVVAGQSTDGGGTQAKPETDKQEAPVKGFSVGEKPAATVTVISVNGSRQALETGARFPSTDPVFVLIAEQPKAKTATIGIAGGAYESGAKTLKLRVGRPVVLENTATGARYKLVLVSVGSGAPKADAAPAADEKPTTAP